MSADRAFSVFATTDSAFAALPAGTVETLLMDPTGDLAQILLYHVVGAEVLSTDLSDGQMATTLEGSDITVTINADGVFINDAMVTMADLPASNGVVHVIDAVLLPVIDNINELDKVDIKVGPNPASEYINITLPTIWSGEAITTQLLDANGKIVTSWQVNNTNTTLNVSSYPAGNYFILMVADNEYALSKIVVK